LDAGHPDVPMRKSTGTPDEQSLPELHPLSGGAATAVTQGQGSPAQLTAPESTNQNERYQQERA
jgi:hypothetical protein